jgi:uncharacterized repeat protein (TIGR01451 family)
LDGRVLVAGGTNNGTIVNFVEQTSEIYDPATNSWSAGGNLQKSRSAHTATLLADGRVLLVGGFDGGSNNSAEIFDPATNSWTLAQNMSVGRLEHTATLLSDGRVLVAGGASSPVPLSSAEIYDPATDTWTAATPMTIGHQRHTATLLNDGRVLIIGGFLSTACCSSQVEIYDPVTDSWTPAAPATDASGMSQQSATLLPDGRVLTVGGGQFLGGRIYNPTTNTWFSTGPMMIDGLFGNQSMLLGDGRVMVVGGIAPVGSQYEQAAVEFYNPATDSWSLGPSISIGRIKFTATHLGAGRVLVAGGDSSGGSSIALSAAEIYDPNGINKWSSVAIMSQQRAEHTATLLNDGRVLVAGGKAFFSAFSAANSVTAEAEIYDPVSNSWATAGPLATPRTKHTATGLRDGRVLVTGGWNTSTVFDTAEVYDLAINGWSPAGTMGTARRDHAAILLPDSGGRVLVVGGTSSNSGSPTPLPTAEIYDPATNSWTPVQPMNFARRLHTATLLQDGRVLVVGGGGGSESEVYDPVTNNWTLTGSSVLSDSLEHTATLLADGRVLVAGGQFGNTRSSAEVYDPVTNNWSSAGSMSFPRVEHTATRLLDGSVLVTGGNNISAFLASVNLYDPATNSWFYEDTMRVDRALHTATLLQDGRLLIVGGTHDKALSALANGDSLASGEIFTDLLDQTITFGPLADKTFGDPPLNVAATASSGLLVTFSSAGSCSVSGNTVTLIQAGSCTITASQGGNLFYNPASAVSQSFTILQAIPAITWNNPADIVYGTPLSATQLNAIANVAGTFTYTPAAGTVLNIGNGQILHVDFTPADTTNYTNASKDVTINVLAAPDTTPPTLSNIIAANITATEATINWTTDEPATSAVVFGTCTPILDFTCADLVQVQVNNDEFVTNHNITLVGLIPSTTYYFVVASTDSSGNGPGLSDESSFTTNALDVIAPDTTITANPPKTTTSTSASFEFTSTEAGSTFECSLDTAVFAACTSPQDFTGLATGSHTFQVRAIDPAGNTDSTPASYDWTINAPAPATLTLSSLVHIQDGTPKSAVVTTSPPGLSGVNITYNGSSTPPTNAGSYLVTASLTNPDYTASDVTSTLVILANDPGATPKIYWADSGADKLQRANLDGSDTQDLIAGLVGPGGVALDFAGGQVYWADRGAPKVQRAGLDGSNLEDLLFGGTGFPFGFPIGIALDVPGGKMYFAEALFGQSIRRANLDGSGLETIVSGIGAVTGVALDLSAGKVYWTNAGLSGIERANLDGSNRESVVTGLLAPRHLVLDIAGGKIYWADQVAGAIQRANIDGSGLETLITALTAPYGISLDITNGKIYWSEIFDGRIRRANIDGSGIETIISGLVNPEGLALLIPDTTAPDATMTSAPLLLTNSTSATFHFTSTEANSTFECKLDGESFILCSSPQTYTDLAEGGHTFQVRAKDLAGNVGSPTNHAWTIDIAPPETAINVSPPLATNSTSATFEFTSDDAAATFECKLDNAVNFTSCNSPQSYTGLADGSHTFEVRAVDAAGNFDISPVSHAWSIDATPPTITVTSPAENATYQLNANVAASYACVDSGSGVAACQGTVGNGSPIDTSSTGTKTFIVTAMDIVGNAAEVTVTYSVVSGGGGGSTSADLGITLSAPARVSPGGTLTYSITISNGGKATATGVVVSDPLPAGTVFASAAASQGTVVAPPAGTNGTVTVEIGSLANGAKATISIVTTVTAPPETVLNATATVTATTQDLNSKNNSATEKTTVAKK